MKRLLLGLLVGAVGLGTGCGSGGSRNGGFPFVPGAYGAGAATDFCGGFCSLPSANMADPPPGATTATFSQPEVGKACLSGTTAVGGWADLGLVFAEWNQDSTKVLKPFDAASLGITQMAFTIDSPPSGGITVDAAIITSLECLGSPPDYSTCSTWGFDLMTDSQSYRRLNITQPGPQLAPFVNFKQTRVGVTQTFDTTALNYVVFGVGAGAYDFCVHDFEFLDAAGNEVKP